MIPCVTLALLMVLKAIVDDLEIESVDRRNAEDRVW
jgi:hypothetical protein